MPLYNTRVNTIHFTVPQVPEDYESPASSDAPSPLNFQASSPIRNDPPIATIFLSEVSSRKFKPGCVTLQPSSSRKLKNHVPRPPNAFILFRSDVVAKGDITGNVEKDHRHISRICGFMWKQLTEEEKKPYLLKAEYKKALHDRLHPDYQYHPASRARPRNKRRTGRSSLSDVIRSRTVAELVNEGYKGEALQEKMREEGLELPTPAPRRSKQANRASKPCDCDYSRPLSWFPSEFSSTSSTSVANEEDSHTPFDSISYSSPSPHDENALSSPTCQDMLSAGVLSSAFSLHSPDAVGSSTSLSRSPLPHQELPVFSDQAYATANLNMYADMSDPIMHIPVGLQYSVDYQAYKSSEKVTVEPVLMQSYPHAQEPECSIAQAQYASYPTHTHGFACSELTSYTGMDACVAVDQNVFSVPYLQAQQVYYEGATQYYSSSSAEMMQPASFDPYTSYNDQNAQNFIPTYQWDQPTSY